MKRLPSILSASSPSQAVGLSPSYAPRPEPSLPMLGIPESRRQSPKGERPAGNRLNQLAGDLYLGPRTYWARGNWRVGAEKVEGPECLPGPSRSAGCGTAQSVRWKVRTPLGCVSETGSTWISPSTPLNLPESPVTATRYGAGSTRTISAWPVICPPG